MGQKVSLLARIKSADKQHNVTAEDSKDHLSPLVEMEIK